MWQPIFAQNKAFLLSAIDAFSVQLAAFRKAIEADDVALLNQLMK
jgi:prephenate dehydrogenase